MDRAELRLEMQRNIEAYALTMGLPYDHPDVFQEFNAQATGWDIVNAVATARLAVMSYQSEARVRYCLGEFSGVNDHDFVWLEDKAADTQGFAVEKHGDIFLAFRGSESLRDWWRNLTAWREFTTETGPADGIIGHTHKGFKDGLDAVWECVAKFLETRAPGSTSKVWLTGHSLGGALATIATARIACNYGGNSIGGLYTFGQPRVVNREFAHHMVRVIGRSKIHRVYRCADPVPIVPRGYKHVNGERCYISKQGAFLPGANALRKWWERSLTWAIITLKLGVLKMRPYEVYDAVSHHFMDGYLSALRNAKRDYQHSNHSARQNYKG